jgi:hypothetical protein
MSSLKDEMRRFVERMPEKDEDWTKKAPTKGPNPTTYPGRPNWCGGALLREKNHEGEWVDRRVYCTDEGGPAGTLCGRCAALERVERDSRKRMQTGVVQEAVAQKQAVEHGVIVRKPRFAK